MVATARTVEQSTSALRDGSDYGKSAGTAAFIGKIEGIDPVSGCVWIGDAAGEIVEHSALQELAMAFDSVRAGFDHDLPKETHQRSRGMSIGKAFVSSGSGFGGSNRAGRDRHRLQR
jgi:hypothetical protein